MDVDYSPTGREFVAGSYDRSVRVFAYNGGRSREVYHTKRMQRYVLRCIMLGAWRMRACTTKVGLTQTHRDATIAAFSPCASAAMACTCSAAART
jgi:hypothetical protein